MIASDASIPVMIKIPGTPIRRFNPGAMMSERAKTVPIVIPIAAIALVRCSSRVRSAASAITAAEIAPEPWTIRPNITQ